MDWKRLIKIKALSDKMNHLFFGTLLFLLFSLVFDIHMGFVFVTIVGATVECVDYVSKKGTPEILDFIYTILVPMFVYIIYLICNF